MKILENLKAKAAGIMELRLVRSLTSPLHQIGFDVEPLFLIESDSFSFVRGDAMLCTV